MATYIIRIPGSKRLATQEEEESIRLLERSTEIHLKMAKINRLLIKRILAGDLGKVRARVPKEQ
jgi:hypothetical protein